MEGDVRAVRDLASALSPLEGTLGTPALVVDLAAFEHNVAAMIRRVGGVERYCPHVKTLKQTRLLGHLLDAGLRAMKCATLPELAAIASALASRPAIPSLEVTFAFPAHGPLAEAIADLVAQCPRLELRLLADGPTHAGVLAERLSGHAARDRLGLALDVDLGMHRTGRSTEVYLDAIPRLREVHAGLRITTLHGYDGHLRFHETAQAHAGYDALLRLAMALVAAGIPPERVITSGTHSYAHALTHEGLRRGPFLHQVSPGTVLLLDLRSDAARDDAGLRQAAFVASRVVSTPMPGRATLDAGSKGIAPDRPPPSCRILAHDEAIIGPASEEHLVVTWPRGTCPLGLGDLVFLVPDHVCTTVNLYDEVLYVRDDRFEGRGRVEAARRQVSLP